jgi:hypothetical protein
MKRAGAASRGRLDSRRASHDRPLKGGKIGHRPFETEAYIAAFNDGKWRFVRIGSLSTRGKVIFSAFLATSVM